MFFLRSRRIVIILAVAVIIAGWIFIQQFTGKKTVSLYPSSGVTIVFGTFPANTENGPRIQKALVKTGSYKTLHVKKGYYLAEFEQPGRQTNYAYVKVGADTSIHTPQMSYTQNNLAAMLNREKPGIEAQLAASPDTANYTPGYERLYGQGDWFAATLMPSIPGLVEQRIILHKEGEKWITVAGPSSVFYIGTYPSIPQAVIRDINNN